VCDKVTACDMKKVPLADEALDVAVFSLSLMGKNWSEYITEAKRCLVTNGILIIAETTKSLKGRLSNLRDEIQKQTSLASAICFCSINFSFKLRMF
jgi:ribosomal RNA-processing protein 8